MNMYDPEKRKYEIRYVACTSTTTTLISALCCCSRPMMT